MSAIGYIDFGFFGASGNGVGIVQDSGPAAARVFPQYADRNGWVFYGDILSPAINTRGEVADLGDFAGVDSLRQRRIRTARPASSSTR